MAGFFGFLSKVGTPPRMQGKLVLRGAHGTAQGTPPRMRGKLRRKTRSCLLLGEHPRVCGENASLRFLTPPTAGTPPRMREKLETKSIFGLLIGTPPRMRENSGSSLPRFEARGNTPAYAGKTLHHQHVSEPKPSFSITSSDKPTLQQACRSSQPGVVHRR